MEDGLSDTIRGTRPNSSGMNDSSITTGILRLMPDGAEGQSRFTKKWLYETLSMAIFHVYIDVNPPSTISDVPVT